MMRLKYIRAALLGFSLALAVGVQAGVPAASTDEAALRLDEVILKDGSRILGTVISAREGVIVIETGFAGEISIDATAVDFLQTRGSMTVLMDDGSTIRDQPILVDQEGIVVKNDAGVERAYGVSEFQILNPEPWELGEGYKWFGLANLVLAVEEGNTVSEELDYKVESFWRSLRDRYTLKLYGEVDEASGVKNADNNSLVGKYDYFLEGSNYWGLKFAAMQDEFADLDLRAYAGPYYGRQFYERPIFTLSGEAGLAYVSEDFIVAPDQQYTGAHWDINLTTDYLGGDSKIYIEQRGLWNLEEPEDIVLHTTFGLSFPLLGNLEVAAELLLEYDTGAVEGVEELDQKYKFRIGYTW
jgi:hypothetical protein